MVRSDDPVCPVCKRSTPTQRTWHPAYNHLCSACGVLFNGDDTEMTLATYTLES
ncbi:hypothetical protein [Halocatena halophila]|uniref:hypothetical protein n=1 Tax=Halocatena halophila TaxID=2814576 RepID=UPI002ED1F177